MLPEVLPFAIATMVLMLVAVVLVVRAYHVAAPGRALVVWRGGRGRVLFEGGMLAIPGLDRVETLELGERSFEVRCEASRAPTFADGRHAKVVASVRVELPASEGMVLEVARVLGAARANDAAAVEAALTDRLVDALRSAAETLSFEAASAHPERLGDAARAQVESLDGFRVVDLRVESVAPA